MTRLALAAAGLLASIAAMPAPACAQATPHTTVRFGDLNLNHAADVRILSRRVDAAAYYVCGGPPTTPVEYGGDRDYRACHSEAVSSALATIGSPQLTAMMTSAQSIRLAGR